MMAAKTSAIWKCTPPLALRNSGRSTQPPPCEEQVNIGKRRLAEETQPSGKAGSLGHPIAASAGRDREQGNYCRINVAAYAVRVDIEPIEQERIGIHVQVEYPRRPATPDTRA